MPNPNFNTLATTTLNNRSRTIADNVTKSTPLLMRLQQRGKVRPVSGGIKITEAIQYAENPNFGWYTGYDPLPIHPGEVLTRAEFPWKQCSCQVVASGLELMQNRGPEAEFDLVEEKVQNAETTVTNQLSTGVFSDGTGYGGKQITGLAAYIVATPTTGVAGGIDRATDTWWRNKTSGALGAQTADTILPNFSAMYLQLTRGADKPDLIVTGATWWGLLQTASNNMNMFTNTNVAKLGFPSISYMGADVVYDPNVGATVAYFLNTDYISLRPHRERNLVVLNPDRRQQINQDAQVTIFAWMGNMTISNMALQGYVTA